MEKNKSNTIDNSNNIRTLNSLYNLLVDSLTEFLPIYVSLNNQTYSKNSLPSDVISAKIRLHEIETANLKLVNKIQISQLKQVIKSGFSSFASSSNTNLYTTFYFSDPIHLYKLSSNNLIKKLYNFLEDAYSENQNPIVYLKDISITISDIRKKSKKKTFAEFEKNIINKLSIDENSKENEKENKFFKNNNLFTEYNSNKMFKKLDLLYDFLNIPKERCSTVVNKKTSYMFKTINIA